MLKSMNMGTLSGVQLQLVSTCGVHFVGICNLVYVGVLRLLVEGSEAKGCLDERRNRGAVYCATFCECSQLPFTHSLVCTGHVLIAVNFRFIFCIINLRSLFPH